MGLIQVKLNCHILLTAEKPATSLFSYNVALFGGFTLHFIFIQLRNTSDSS